VSRTTPGLMVGIRPLYTRKTHFYSRIRSINPLHRSRCFMQNAHGVSSNLRFGSKSRAKSRVKSRAKSRPKTSTKSKAIWVVLLLIALIALAIVGLRPYASFKDNWVSFSDSSSTTEFGEFGLVVGVIPDIIGAQQQQLQISFTPTITKQTDSRFQVFAQLDSPGSTDPLIIGQWNTELVVMNGVDYHDRKGIPRVAAKLGEHVGKPVDVAVTLSPEETRIDVNGQFAASGEPFSFAEPLMRITIGNSPDGKHGWQGTLADFHLVSLADSDQMVRYRFDVNDLPRIASEGSIDMHLDVPRVGYFPERGWLGAFQFNDLFDRNPRDLLINFLAFLPLGFLVAAVMRTGRRRAHKTTTIATVVVVALLLSLMFESAQMFIPGRSPLILDLILNTAGAFCGAVVFLMFRGRSRGNC